MITNYFRFDYLATQHHKRFAKYVEKQGVTCQECSGVGGETEPVLDYGQGPWVRCGWCEGIGKVPKHIRGIWLTYKRSNI